MHDIAKGRMRKAVIGASAASVGRGACGPAHEFSAASGSLDARALGLSPKLIIGMRRSRRWTCRSRPRWST